MDTASLLQKIKDLEQMILQQEKNNDSISEQMDNVVSAATDTLEEESPSSNLEYRRRLRLLRSGYRKQLRDLKKEFGVAPRYRANYTKVKRG